MIVLNKFFKLVEDYSGKVIFVKQVTGRAEDKTLKTFVSFSQKAVLEIKNPNVLIIDTQKLLDNQKGKPIDLFYHSGVHYSQKGSKLFADFIYRNTWGKAQKALE